MAKSTASRRKTPKRKASAPPKKTAAKPARTAPAPRQAAAAPRQVVLDADKARLARATATAMVEESSDELIAKVASHVITDLADLRKRAIEAMGDEFVGTVRGADLIEDFKRKHAGHGHTFMVHPLEPHVLEGTARINPRDFSEPEMVERVAELAVSIAARGVQKPAPMFIQRIDGEERLVVKGGETRLRATLMCWVLRDSGLLGSNAPETFPINLEKGNTNDVDRLLDFDIDNNQRPLKPIEQAMLYKHALELGATEETIAKKTGKSLQTIRNLLAMTAMPEKILNLVRSRTISMSFAWKCWERSGQDRELAIKTIEDAIQTAQYAGASRVMPRHVAADMPSGSAGGRAGASGGSARPSSSSRASGGDSPAEREVKQTAAYDGLKRLFDTMNGAGANASVRVEDGFVLMPFTLEAYLSFASKIGWPVTEDMGEDEPVVQAPPVAEAVAETEAEAEAEDPIEGDGEADAQVAAAA